MVVLFVDERSCRPTQPEGRRVAGLIQVCRAIISRVVRTLPLLLCALAVAASPLQVLAASDPRIGCRFALRTIDRAVVEAAVRDAEAVPVPGFPYLRASRFLASFASEIQTEARFEAWMQRMATLDREGRRFEMRNLGGEARTALETTLAQRLGPSWTAASVLEHCPRQLHALDLADPAARERLIEATSVPDDYALAARTIGLYPLTAIPIAQGWERWQETNLPAFEVAFGDSVFEGQPTVYRPETTRPPLPRGQTSMLIAAADRDPLGVPDLDRATLARLAEAYAPVFLIDIASEADRVGRPAIGPDQMPTVDPAQPVAFVRWSHARLDGTPVFQLSYTVWFAARPSEGGLDLLSGRLDGLIWRITFGPDGRPFVYDTIHPCGCYHLFFPAPGTTRLAVPEDRVDDLREAPTVPKSAPDLSTGERMALRVAATSHYLSGLAGTDALDGGLPEVRYRLVMPEVADAPLRALLSEDGGTLSLFGPDGLVAGTERLERLVLWPMGIASPGAMRQWGRHATAFVGRRHFDDPHLFDQAFAR